MSIRPIARLLIRKRCRSAALAMGALRDPVALSRLELHRLAARAFDRDPAAARASPVERIRSLNATGRAGEALDVARTLAPRPEHDLALSFSAFDPALALTKYAGSDASLRAALMLAAGREDDARRALETAPGPQAAFLRASLDRHHAARAAPCWREGFGAWSLSPPEPVDPALPVSVTNARAEAAPAVDGPLISVIMPSRNASRWVAGAVRSVLDQSWRNLEFLFVDDASTDDNADRALATADGDPRFILIRQSERGGAYTARNAALARARGRWVAVQDSDEWAHPDRLTRQV
ncbi:MAG: glycosyltransferase family 2 protein, partial [Brevundimonas sp.]